MRYYELPKITGSVEEQLEQIKEFIFLQTEAMNYNLDNSTPLKIWENTRTALVNADNEKEKEEVRSTYNALRDIIIGTADIAVSKGDTVSKILNSVYLAQSQYGTFLEQIQRQIEETAAGTRDNYTYIGQVSEGVAASILNLQQSVTQSMTELSGSFNTDLQGLESLFNGNLSTLETTLNGNISTLGTTLSNTFNGNLSSLETTLNGNINALGTTLNGNISSLETTFNGNLSTLESTLNGNIDNLETTLNGNITDLSDSIAGDLSDLSDSLSGDISDVEDLITGTGGINDQISGIGSDIAGIGNDITGINNDINGLSGDIDSLGADISDVADGLDTYKLTMQNYINTGYIDDGIFGIDIGLLSQSITHNGVTVTVETPKKVRITPDRVSFYDGSSEVAYIAQNAIHFPAAVIEGGSISINNGTFSVTSGGVVTATSGTIGGWGLISNAIWQGSYTFGNENGMYFGANGLSIKDKFLVDSDGDVTISSGSITLGENFTVTNAGVLTCSNAVISGQVSATSGTIGGWEIGNGTLSSVNENGASITLTSGGEPTINVSGDTTGAPPSTLAELIVSIYNNLTSNHCAIQTTYGNKGSFLTPDGLTWTGTLGRSQYGREAWVSGGITTGGSLTVAGTIGATGSISTLAGMTVGGNLTVNGTFSVGTFSPSSVATGDATMNTNGFSISKTTGGILGIGGTTKTSSYGIDASVAGNLTVSGTFSPSSISTSSLTLNGINVVPIETTKGSYSGSGSKVITIGNGYYRLILSHYQGYSVYLLHHPLIPSGSSGTGVFLVSQSTAPAYAPAITGTPSDTQSSGRKDYSGANLTLGHGNSMSGGTVYYILEKIS